MKKTVKEDNLKIPNSVTFQAMAKQERALKNCDIKVGDPKKNSVKKN